MESTNIFSQKIFPFEIFELVMFFFFQHVSTYFITLNNYFVGLLVFIILFLFFRLADQILCLP